MPTSRHYEHITFPRPRPWRLPQAPLLPVGGAVAGEEQSGETTPWDDENTAFFRWLFAQNNLDFRTYRLETLQRRFAACLRACHSSSVWEARRRLENNPGLVPGALSALLLGVTAFFRDNAVFEQLDKHLLPRLVAEREYLRIWSIGCSDGSELYSVAMLLAEKNLLSRCYLVGSDCRSDALEQARAGVFDAAAVRQIPAHLAAKYLDLERNRLTISQPLRMAARWWPQDALKIPESCIWDIILCRNMAMYLTSTAAAGLWRTLANSVRPGGVLVLGKAERPTNAAAFVSIGPCLYQRARG